MVGPLVLRNFELSQKKLSNRYDFHRKRSQAFTITNENTSTLFSGILEKTQIMTNFHYLYTEIK